MTAEFVARHSLVFAWERESGNGWDEVGLRRRDRSPSKQCLNCCLEVVKTYCIVYSLTHSHRVLAVNHIG